MARAARPDMYRSAGLALVPVHPGSLVLFGRDVVLPATRRSTGMYGRTGCAAAVRLHCGTAACAQSLAHPWLHVPSCL